MSDETKAKRLGRGLSALLGEDLPEIGQEPPRGTRTVPIEMLRPNRHQPRRHFGEDELEELAASIAEKGVLQPIIVRADPERPGAYEIVAGERRWRAAQRARLHEVPVVVRAFADNEMLEIAIIENVQRADLDPLEEAHAYQALLETHGRNIGEVVKIIGKSRSHIVNTMRLLMLPEKVQAMIASGTLSAGHARALVGTENAEELADKIAALQLSVRETEALVRQPGRGSNRRHKRGAAPKDADTRALEDNVARALGLKVTVLDRGEKGGEVRIAYKSLDQLDEICRRLKRA